MGGGSFVLEIQTGGDASGNPGERGLKNAPIHLGVWIFSGITHSELYSS